MEATTATSNVEHKPKPHRVSATSCFTPYIKGPVRHLHTSTSNKLRNNVKITSGRSYFLKKTEVGVEKEDEDMDSNAFYKRSMSLSQND